MSFKLIGVVTDILRIASQSVGLFSISDTIFKLQIIIQFIWDSLVKDRDNSDDSK